ncbi:hypothetical protein C8F04DRAFT_1253808 [Mycena alexandri]|uniref:Threonine/serine exporter-like N-terminal domain-containing protein n=1 Tax=Mycena alexandri TaxID=1745969 RepID=A0AAD6XA59_9AGAR|nr:hypothetical protein C8F04DRAFT_1253808 [Mycena alexandri]
MLSALLALYNEGGDINLNRLDCVYTGRRGAPRARVGRAEVASAGCAHTLTFPTRSYLRAHTRSFLPSTRERSDPLGRSHNARHAGSHSLTFKHKFSIFSARNIARAAAPVSTSLGPDLARAEWRYHDSRAAFSSPMSPASPRRPYVPSCDSRKEVLGVLPSASARERKKRASAGGRRSRRWRRLPSTQEEEEQGGDVIYDEESVSEVSRTLDALMLWQRRNLSPLVVAIQLLNVRNELYSNVFQFTAATLFSLVPAALASTKLFCDSAVASSSVVPILPGFMVRRPPIIPRNIVSGSVRMRYAVVYSLFLGLGLAVGVDDRITGRSTDYTCSESHDTEGRGIRRLGCVSATVYAEEQLSNEQRPAFLTFEHAESGAVGESGDGPARRPRVHRLAHSRGASYVSFLSRNAFVIMSTAYLAGFQTALQLISVVIGDDGLGLSLALTVVDMGLFMGR